MGSKVAHTGVVVSRRRALDHTTASSWETMDRPVRIGTTHSDGSTGNQTQPTQEQNRAEYVNTQENPGDIMATIASEFEMYAQRSSSLRNSHGASSQTSQPRRSSDVTNDASSSQLYATSPTGTTGTHRSQNGLGAQGQLSLQSSPRPRLYADSPLSEQGTATDRVTRLPVNSHSSSPPAERHGSNPVRQTRTTQLRNTMASQNREQNMTSGQEATGNSDRNSTSVSGGQDTADRRTHRLNPRYDSSQQNARPAPQTVPGIDGDIQQKALLDLMTRGFRTFTVEMADVIIAKLKPQHEALARLVGKEVKRETNKEIKQLRDDLERAEATNRAYEAENTSLVTSLGKERDATKKELESEILKRAKMYQEQSAIITKLGADVQKLKNAHMEKDKLWRKAELKVKAEENKRLKIEEEFAGKLRDMQKQLDRVKGDLLVQKSVKRLQTASSNSAGSRANSHHGGYKKQLIQPKHVPYDEGD